MALTIQASNQGTRGKAIMLRAVSGRVVSFPRRAVAFGENEHEYHIADWAVEMKLRDDGLDVASAFGVNPTRPNGQTVTVRATDPAILERLDTMQLTIDRLGDAVVKLVAQLRQDTPQAPQDTLPGYGQEYAPDLPEGELDAAVESVPVEAEPGPDAVDRIMGMVAAPPAPVPASGQAVEIVHRDASGNERTIHGAHGLDRDPTEDITPDVPADSGLKEYYNNSLSASVERKARAQRAEPEPGPVIDAPAMPAASENPLVAFMKAANLNVNNRRR